MVQTQWYACPICNEIGAYNEYHVADETRRIDLPAEVFVKHWHLRGAIKLGLNSEVAARRYVETKRKKLKETAAS